MLSPEARDALKTELTHFAADLNLSDDQKTQLKSALENARERIDDARAKHPDISKADIAAKVKEMRPALRQKVENFLTPEQLQKWDAEVGKAKSFLGYTN